MGITLILLGSGSSVEYGIPGTEELTTLLDEHIHDDSFVKYMDAVTTFDYIISCLKGYLTRPGIVHFEHIYHCIHELYNYTIDLDSDAFDEFRFLMKPFLNLFEPNMIQRMKLSALEQKYTYGIYKKISDSCNHPRNPLSSLSSFISEQTSENLLRIYSLNYDDLPLQAVPDLYTGFNRGAMAQFGSRDFWSNLQIPSFFQLHGSVHLAFPSDVKHDPFELYWFEDKAESLKHIESLPSPKRRGDGGSSTRLPIITGLDKTNKIIDTPFNYYHSCFSYDILRADTIIIAGYGLYDLHINYWIKQARRSDPQKRIIFIDFWESDYNISSLSRKNIEIVQTLRIESQKATKIKHGWILIPEYYSAIYTKGFQSFLDVSTHHNFRDIIEAISPKKTSL